MLSPRGGGGGRGGRLVPHSQSGAVPMSSLSGVGQLGLWEVGEGGIVGLRGGANRVSLQAT
jgi:hypothetical protein